MFSIPGTWTLGVEEKRLPAFARRGGRAIKKVLLPSKARTGRLVMMAKPTADARVAHRSDVDIKKGPLRGHKRKLRNITNHPACAFRGRKTFI